VSKPFQEGKKTLKMNLGDCLLESDTQKQATKRRKAVGRFVNDILEEVGSLKNEVMVTPLWGGVFRES